MNPWIDIGMLSMVLLSLIFLRYEIPRAAAEIESILAEAKRAKLDPVWYDNDRRKL